MPPPEGAERCQAYIVEVPLDTATASAHAAVLTEGRAQLAVPFEEEFQWVVPAHVGGGGAATGYDAAKIRVRGQLDIGETFVQSLDPQRCAEGFCFDRDELVKCDFEHDYWFRQVFTLRLSTSDEAFSGSLTGSGRIMPDGSFTMSTHRWDERFHTHASQVTGSLRITPDEPRDPLVAANLAMVDGKWRGDLSVQLFAACGDCTSPYTPIAGRWPVDACATTELEVTRAASHSLLAGRAPEELLSDVKDVVGPGQRTKWTNGSTESLSVGFGEAHGRACINEDVVRLPQQALTVVTDSGGLNLPLEGLTILHREGQVHGFHSDAWLKYSKGEQRLAEEFPALSAADGDRFDASLSFKNAETLFDTGFGTWSESTYPAWFTHLRVSRWLTCLESICEGFEHNFTCLSTEAEGYDLCATPEVMGVTPVAIGPAVARLAQQLSPVTPSTAPLPSIVAPPPVDETTLKDGGPTSHADAGLVTQ